MSENQHNENIVILVVDDHEDNRFTLIHRLKRLGYNNCLEAENGVEAIKTLKENKIDLMLLDLMMPEMDGFEVLEILNQEGTIHNLPVIMISADHNMDNVVKGIELGAVDYLPKPFQPALLKARVTSSLRQKELREFEKNYLELHDKETGLGNKKKLHQEVDNLLRKDTGEKFALAIFKTNTLREIGASAGSSQQKEFLNYLLSTITPLKDEGVVITRTSDFQFGLLFTDFETEWEVIERLNKFLSDVKLPITIAGQEYFPNPVIGLSFSNNKTTGTQTLFSEVETALDRAKPDNENELCVFDPKMQEQMQKNAKLQVKLLHAIEENELELYYQPFVDMKAGDIIGAEALVRWNEKDGTVVPPFEFIPLAEETGLILPMGDWILEEGFRQTHEWNKNLESGKVFTISINVSPRQLMEQNIFIKCQEYVEKWGELPIKLEITETSLMDNPEKAKTVLSNLRKLGLSPSMDDFGTGYSSLGTLHEFPFSTLKIDQSFIRRLTQHDEAKEIVQSIIYMAHALALDVVAEGIETKEELEMLREMKCDIGQGYYFSKPVPVAEFEELVAKKPKW